MTPGVPDMSAGAPEESEQRRDQLTTDIALRPGIVEMTVHGELDMSTVAAMTDRATRQLTGRSALVPDTEVPATLILDFAGVTFCDSAGANGLIRLRNDCDRLGWNFQLTGLQGHVRRVLVDLMGLGGVLNVPPTDEP